MKIRNLKIVSIIVGGVLLAGTSTIAFFGEKLEKKYINHKIEKGNASYSDVLDSVAQETTIDDILRPTNYKDIISGYQKYRDAGDYEKASKYLSELTKRTLLASICEYEQIEMENVKSFETWIDVEAPKDGKANLCAKCSICFEKEEIEQTSGNIVTSRLVEISTSYNLKDQLFDMAYNIAFLNQEIVSCSGVELSQEDKLKQLDNIYLSLERFLVTKEIKLATFSSETLRTSYDLGKSRSL